MVRAPRMFADLVLIGLLGVAIPVGVLGALRPAALSQAANVFLSNHSIWIEQFAEPYQLLFDSMGLLSALLIVGFVIYLLSDILSFISVQDMKDQVSGNSKWFDSFFEKHLNHLRGSLEIIQQFEVSGNLSSRLAKTVNGYKALRRLETSMLAFLTVRGGNSIPEDLIKRRAHRRVGFSVAIIIAYTGALVSWPVSGLWFLPFLIVILMPSLVVFFPVRTSSRYYTILFCLVYEQFAVSSNRSARPSGSEESLGP